MSNDADVRLWHVENCDNIKQVIEQNKAAKNTKIVSVSNDNGSISHIMMILFFLSVRNVEKISHQAK